MADAVTPNLALTKPEVGGSRDSWGDKTNANWDKLDTAVKAAQDKANGAVVKASGSGSYVHWSLATFTSGLAFLVPSAGTDPTSAPGDIWFGY